MSQRLRSSRRRSERLSMNVGLIDTPVQKRGAQGSHHRVGSAEVERMTTVRQDLFQEVGGDEPGMVKIPPRHIGCSAIRVKDMQAESRMGLGHLSENGLEGVIPAIANAIEQMYRAIRMSCEGRFQHRQDWRDADTACNENRGRIGIRGQGELPGGSANLYYRAR